MANHYIFFLKIVGKAQIRGKNAVNAVITTDDGAVPYAIVAQSRPEDRLPIVDVFPMKAIPAQANIDLLPLGGFRFPEMAD